MSRFTTSAFRFNASATAISLLSLLAITACSRRDGRGNLTIFGVVYYIVVAVSIVDVFRQPWDTGRKILWTLVLLIPFLGLLLYYAASGREKRRS